MFPSHSAIRANHRPPPPSRNARAPVLLSSGRSAETSQPGQAGPQLRSSRITLHRHARLHMLILHLHGVGYETGVLCPLDASQLTGSSGNAARRRGHSNSRGQARFTSARAHFWRRLPDANWAPSEARAQTNANMTASVVGYHAPGMGDGVDGRTRQGKAGANRKWEKVGAR